MRIIATVLAFILVVCAGCNKGTKVIENKENQPTVSETTVNKPAEQPSEELVQLEKDVAFLASIYKSKTLDGAILNALPRLGSAHQDNDEISMGAAGLMWWAYDNLKWSDLSDRDSVTYPEFRKEETIHTGKRICVNAHVAEIYAIQTEGNKIEQNAVLVDINSRSSIYLAFLFKSTNGVYQDSIARFCGIAVENKQYKTVLNERRNAIVVFGFFDLPENY